MASFRLGQVLRTAAGGVALFAEERLEREREEAARAWALELENVRETRAMAREQRAIDRENARESRAVERDRLRIEADTARYEAQTEATAAYRTATLEQDESQFNRRQVADAEDALRKRITEIEEQYQDALEANFGEDPDGSLAAKMMDRRDHAVTSFVQRMAGRPGYEEVMQNPGAFTDALIKWQVEPDAADYYAGSFFAPPGTKPTPPPGGETAPAPGQPTPTTAVPPMQPGAPAGLDAMSMQDAANSTLFRPVDMIKGPQPGGQQPLSPWVYSAGRGVRDFLQTDVPQTNDNPYALMGQRPGG